MTGRGFHHARCNGSIHERLFDIKGISIHPHNGRTLYPFHLRTSYLVSSKKMLKGEKNENIKQSRIIFINIE